MKKIKKSQERLEEKSVLQSSKVVGRKKQILQEIGNLIL
jgi:hypothetical protein